MELLRFTVRNQNLSGGRNKLVSDSIDYVEAYFDFRTSDWSGLSKWAHFSKGEEVYDINLVDDKITRDMHLNLGAGTWEVKLHGTDPEGTMRITTDRANVVVESYGSMEEGSPLPEIPLSQAEQIDAKAQNAINLANSLKEELDKENSAPVKGVDYWTEADKAEIVAETAEAIKAMEEEDGLTERQINALDSMFRVCAFINEDVSEEYGEFREAFGLDESEEEEHSHSYTSSVTTAAGCLTSGVRTYTCSCGSSYTEVIPATRHSFVNGVCSVCGEEEPNEDEPVTLVSISAKYSGGEVAAGTSVNNLTGIVVTAVYSDGSTETVTGYTLSGNISAGSNTVTVSYGGKTATFTVTGIEESSDEPVLAYYWDFTTGSLVDSVSSVEAITDENLTVDSTGAHFTSADSFLKMPVPSSDLVGSTVEVEFGEMSFTSGSSRRLYMVASSTSGTMNTGLFYSTKGCWTSATATITEYTDAAMFANGKLVVKHISASSFECYFNDQLICTPGFGTTINVIGLGGWTTALLGDQSYFPMTVKSVKVYKAA